jgi:hypothetical protein
LNEEYPRPAQATRALSLVLLARPMVSGGFNDCWVNWVVNGYVNALGDHQKLLSVALQRCVGHTPAGAMVQK